MGINADKTLIQMKMLNSSKGPSVHSLSKNVLFTHNEDKQMNQIQNTLLHKSTITKI